MMGYASTESENLVPREYELARFLCQQIYEKFSYDGKVQVTIDGSKIVSVVTSFQNTKTIELEKLVRSIINADEYLINPAGEWTIGGFYSEFRLSVRIIVIYAYWRAVA